ncbi:unnamed protein product [Bursaphelenchus okinawaensis]|uniref:Mothers against decapentaplegic homolog n=1 Tax=Bursaphelenchus okinawaensis TaxID=465554 RepID=A0A811KQY1_9BILA|nr:unnamed protein product [Bursaphelenchus okinawaensis]CAG9108307.1 unnamed protein product [Bursaphelenchus okinawaensis]
MPRWLMTQPSSSSPLTGCLMEPFLAANHNSATFPYEQHHNIMQPSSSGVSHTKVDRNVATPSSSSSSGQDPCAQVVQVLLCYHQGGEDPDFIKKAIESLVKKLKDKQKELDALISAVTSGGKQATSCVTINRSLDGRLQVAGRKGVPHVVYTRIWRWPNVSKNELQKLQMCTTPSDHPDLICINPFHYDRVVSSSIGAIDMNSLRMEHLRTDFIGRTGHGMGIGTSGANIGANGATCSNGALGTVNHNGNANVDKMAGSTSTNGTNIGFSPCVQSPGASESVLQEKLLTPFMYGPHQQPSYIVSHLSTGDAVANNATVSNSNTVSHMATYSNSQSLANGTISSLSADGTLSNLTSNDTNGAGSHLHGADGVISHSFAPNAKDWCKNDFNLQDFPSGSKENGNTYGARYNTLRHNLSRIRIPNACPVSHWCSISYYELDTQIGQTFKVPRDQSEVTIDGGMDPAGARLGRFCLGALSNVHRSEASEKARLHIGRGIKLKQTPDGNVYLTCLSQKGAFVRSYFLDFEHGLVYGSTVHKFSIGAEKKIFDLRWAFSEMCEQRQSAQLAVAAQAYAVAGIMQNVIAPSVLERAGTGVDDLRRVCCTLAISFVKGWGTGYNRSTIKETPCWIEVQLHRPLQLLNGILRKTE